MGTTATSGLYNDPTTWVGGVVPANTNAFVVAKPGTATTRLTTTAGFAVGVTSIAVQAGTGTIVAGECVEFLIVTGTDEFGEPIYDPTYYRVTTGITASPGTLVITPGLVNAIPAGAAMTLRNCGHRLEYNGGTLTLGNDTSGAWTINGTLYFSRSVASALTFRGAFTIANGGTLDAGRPGDPITAVSCALRLNDSAVNANNKFLYTKSAGGFFRSAGKVRTRRTQTSAAITAGATSIQVGNAAGWEVGDQIAVFLTAQRSDAPTQINATYSIAAGYTSGDLTVPLGSSVAVARDAGAFVVNLTSNVRFVAANAGTPQTQLNLNGCNGIWQVQARDTEFNFGASGNHIPIGGSVRAGGFDAIASRCSMWWIGTSGNAFEALAGSLLVDTVAFNAGNGVGIVLSAGLVRRGLYYANILACNSPGNVFSRSDIDGAAIINSGALRAGDIVSVGTAPANCTIASMQSGSDAQLFGMIPSGTFRACDFAYVPSTMRSVAPGGTLNSGRVTFVDCRLTDTTDTINWGQFRGLEFVYQNCFRRSAPTVRINEVLLNASYGNADASLRRNGVASLRLVRRAARFADSISFALIVGAGATVNIRANIRRDATYGAGGMPTLTVALPGVSPVVSSVPDTADTWHPVSLTITNSGASPSEALVTVATAGALNGQAWVDGLPFQPFIQAARWYGFEFDEANPVRVADPTITLTESAAAALTGITIDHTAQTITVTAARTAAEVYCFCMLDLVLNLDGSGGYRARHITSQDGVSFVTTYTVVLSGAGVVNGAYTDATGTNVAISAPNLISGTRVQLFNVTDNTEVANLVIGSGGFSTAFRVTSPKTMRLRATYVSGTSAKMPIQALGVVTAGGLSFVDTQVDDEVYIANAIDGASVTEFAPDYPNIQVDISDPDGETSLQRLYAWHCWNETTAAGVANFFGAIRADDSLNYTVDSGAVSILLDNVNAAPVVVSGGYLRRSDGQTVIAATSGSIQMDPGRAYSASGGAVAADVWGYALESGFSASRVLRTTAAAVAGKTTGGPGGFVARNLADDADQISGTADENGNRNSASYGA